MTERTLSQSRAGRVRALADWWGLVQHGRLGWRDAVAIAAVAAWSPVAVASSLGFEDIPHHKAITLAVPCLLLGLLVIGRGADGQWVLKALAVWSSVLAAALILSPMIVSRPWTFA